MISKSTLGFFILVVAILLVLVSSADAAPAEPERCQDHERYVTIGNHLHNALGYAYNAYKRGELSYEGAIRQTYRVQEQWEQVGCRYEENHFLDLIAVNVRMAIGAARWGNYRAENGYIDRAFNAGNILHVVYGWEA